MIIKKSSFDFSDRSTNTVLRRELLMLLLLLVIVTFMWSLCEQA